MSAARGLLLCITVTLGGCADNQLQRAVDGTSGASPNATSAPSDEPTIGLPPGLPKATGTQPPLDGFGDLTAQGRVRVSGLCTDRVTGELHRDPDRPRRRAAGRQQARATGVPDPDRETPCTGRPLLVTAVEPL